MDALLKPLGVTWADLMPWLYGAIILVVGFVAANLGKNCAHRFLINKATAQQTMIVRRLVYVVILILFIVSALQQVGFKLSVLMGTAGILTVAVGFASQTALSNIISGIFLIFEKTFTIGDIIQVSGVKGKVLSVDIFSVKVCTANNEYVRLPNEMMIKSQITNLTHFALRRVDIPLGISYQEKIETAHQRLLAVAAANKFALQKPEPQFYIKGYGDSSVDLQFSVWVEKDDFNRAKNSLMEDIKNAFEEYGIEIPFPQRVVHLVK